MLPAADDDDEENESVFLCLCLSEPLSVNRVSEGGGRMVHGSDDDAIDDKCIAEGDEGDEGEAKCPCPSPCP